MQKPIDTIIMPLVEPHILSWQAYVQDYFSTQLHQLNHGGDSHLDAGETPELPRQLFFQLNDEWAVETDLVEVIVSHLRQADLDNSLVSEYLVSEPQRLRMMVDGLLKDSALQQAYEDAETVTWTERLLGTNYKDVLAFYQELHTTLSRAIFEAVEWHIAKLLEAVRERMNNPTI